MVYENTNVNLKKIDIENNSYCCSVDILDLIKNPFKLKLFVQQQFKYSKMFLNDFKSIEQLNKYIIDNNYCTYDHDNYNVYYDNKGVLILEQIPCKNLYYDYLENISNVFMKIIQYLENKITYHKHLDKLFELKQFLNSFLSIVLELDNINNYYDLNRFYYYDTIGHDFYDNDYNDYLNKKYLIKNIEQYNINIKNNYKIVKYSFNKVLSILINIIENNKIQ